MNTEIIKLNSEANPYTYWTEKTDSTTGLKVPGYGANTIFRFLKPVMLKAVEIEKFCSMKAKSIVIEVFKGQEVVSEKIFEGTPDWKDDKGTVKFPDAVYALAVSIRCDLKEYAKRQSIMEWDTAEWNVPFSFFEKTRWYGSYAKMPELYIPVQPVLEKGVIAPQPLKRVKAWEDGMFVHFESRYFKISFSLKRPFISHLSWDVFGERPLTKNFLANYLPCHSSGPWTLDLVDSNPPFHWGGSVEVKGSRVIYRGLTCRDGLALDAEFEVQEKGMVVNLTQHCTKQMTLLEASAWRFVWDSSKTGNISTLSIPVRGAHRNGYTEPKGSWHASNEGSLTFEAESSSSPVLMHTEQTGFYGKALSWNYGGFGRRYVFSQIQLGTRPELFGPVTLLAGTYKTQLHLGLGNVEPAVADRATVHLGLRRAWGSGFFFRPEQCGLANNSHSVLAANCLYGTADMSVYTARNQPIPDAVELLRYTLNMALKKGGSHYGSQYKFHHDSAPSLVITAGRIHQMSPDKEWLSDIWPYLKIAIDYLLDNLDDSGMYTSRHHSGDSFIAQGGGSNAWDDIRFGHHDGYSAAFAYRALYSAAALAKFIGQTDLAQRCKQAAPVLKTAYVKSLYNPETGWLAGWRSRDGALHDYGFTFINGMAICYGILEGEQAREALNCLETKRVEIGHTDFRYGLMCQLMPVPSANLTSSSANSLLARGWRNGLRSDGMDTFGVFCNGSLMPAFAGFYINALSKYGFTDTTDQICDQLLESFEQGLFDGDRNGAETFTHEGIPCGYEGSLIHSYYVLAEIAKHKGWVEPLDPEWWPL